MELTIVGKVVRWVAVVLFIHRLICAVSIVALAIWRDLAIGLGKPIVEGARSGKRRDPSAHLILKAVLDTVDDDASRSVAISML